MYISRRTRNNWFRAFAVTSILAWILLFSIGLFVPSEKFRNGIATLDWVSLENLVCAIVTYTPTNCAILTCIAAFVGGCASRLLFETEEEHVKSGGAIADQEHNREDMTTVDDDFEGSEDSARLSAHPVARTQSASGYDTLAIKRSVFLRENPISSMLRGFAVFLAFMAGVYISSSQPFLAPTPEQYARLAGLLSLVGFVTGYDPTMFRNIVKLIPNASRESERQ